MNLVRLETIGRSERPQPHDPQSHDPEPQSRSSSGLTSRCLSSQDESGSALIEAVFGTLFLIVPLLWIALALLRVEAASYAVRSAAREASRTMVTADSSAAGRARAHAAALIAFDDQHAPRGRVTLTCSATPCLTPDATVTARAATDVPLPFVPGWLASATGARVQVYASHAETVERYGGER